MLICQQVDLPIYFLGNILYDCFNKSISFKWKL